MINLTSAQLDAWLLAWVFPMARTLGFIGLAPVFGYQGISRRIRLLVGLAIGFAVGQAIPTPPALLPGSYIGLAVFAQQILIGAGLGLAVRAVFAVTDVAGEIIGLEMGLSFASFFDPQSDASTVVISQILGIVTTLLFLSMNGHLLLIEALVKSFEWIPISPRPVSANGWLAIAKIGSVIFALGLMMALPVVAALLIANIALAVLTRAAPQRNLFSLGFPITVSLGIGLLTVAMKSFAPLAQQVFAPAFSSLDGVMRALR